MSDQDETGSEAMRLHVPIKFLGRELEELHGPRDPQEAFEVDAANLEGPPAIDARSITLRLELRTGTKIEISVHRPDPNGPILAQLGGSPIPSNLTIRELRALSLLIEQAIEAGDDL